MSEDSKKVGGEHTPEPWAAWAIPGDRLGRYAVVCINDEFCPGAGKEVVADTLRTEANARRIAACVNACAGLDTEKLERQNSEGVPLWMFVRDVIAQRDQLLTALEDGLRLIEMLMPGVRHLAIQDYAFLNDAPIRARAAIDQVKGGAA